MQSGTSLPELMGLGGLEVVRDGAARGAPGERSSRRYVFTTVGALKICKRGLRHNHICDLPSPVFAHRHLDSEELHTTSQVQFIRPHKFASTVFNLSDNAKRHAIV